MSKFSQIEAEMESLDQVVTLLATDDGSLPEVDFNYGALELASLAYSVMLRHATCLSSTENAYWDPTLMREVRFEFGENPAQEHEKGRAEAFHVVFGGLQSAEGFNIPDLGFFVLEPGKVSLDYRMGAGWTANALTGLFELMSDLEKLSEQTVITHRGNINDPEGRLLLGSYGAWKEERGMKSGV